MANIAIICEGVSEFKIINHLVARYSGEHFLNAIQPKINDERDTQANDGGWSRVIEHCTDDVFENIFKLNDYLIIQIDTDSSHIQPYDIPHCFSNGVAKSDKRLHAEIKARLMREISHDVRKKYLSRILFAICHNEIECWLLPIFYNDNKRCKTNNCIYHLNEALSKRDIPRIPDKQKNSPNARKAYKKILSNIRKKSDVARIADSSRGFSNFIRGLEIID